MYDIVIIGAGVTGSILARSLAKYDLSILVIDKENDVGNVTSSANSAIVHSGYDPVPGTLKAKLNVLGCSMYQALCEELDVAYSNCGTLTVVDDESQWPAFKSLLERSKENGVKMEVLNPDQIKKIEPNLSSRVLGALYAPSAGIVNPFELVIHAMENAVDNGVKLHLNEEVVNIIDHKEYFEIRTSKDAYNTKVVINAAGLFADKIAKMQEDVSWSITPRKGEYILLDRLTKPLVNRPIFPLPSEKGKGILVAPTTSGNFYLGPSSEVVEDKADYSCDTLTLKAVDSGARRFLDDIPLNKTIRVFAGLRATPSTHDFIIEPSKNNDHFINVAGIESPGLASSPAIAKYVIDNYVSKLFSLKEKDNYNPRVRKHIKLKLLSIEERNKLIKENPDYGYIICQCEQISLGEIEDELTRSVPPRSIKGVKRRTRAGFGRCQGGYCSGIVSVALAKHFHLDEMHVNYDGEGTNLIIEETKKVKL